jgi:hypothetical protein
MTTGTRFAAMVARILLALLLVSNTAPVAVVAAPACSHCARADACHRSGHCAKRVDPEPGAHCRRPAHAGGCELHDAGCRGKTSVLTAAPDPAVGAAIPAAETSLDPGAAPESAVRRMALHSTAPPVPPPRLSIALSSVS